MMKLRMVKCDGSIVVIERSLDTKVWDLYNIFEEVPGVLSIEILEVRP